jgi:hypothetical protein
MPLSAFHIVRIRCAGRGTAVLRPVAVFGGVLVLASSLGSAHASAHKCLDVHGNVGYTDTFCLGQAPRNDAEPVRDTATARLTTKQIQTMMAASDQATRRLDVDAMMRFFADDAQIEMVTRVGKRTGRRSLRKRELAAIAKRHRDDFAGYTLRRERMLIDITPSGTQAEVRSTLIESWREGAQTVTKTTEEQNLIELRDGKPQIVYAYTITNAGAVQRR